MFRLRSLLTYLLIFYSFSAKASERRINDFFLNSYESIEDFGFSSFTSLYRELSHDIPYSGKSKEFLTFLYTLATWLDMVETGYPLDSDLIENFDEVSYLGKSLNSQIVKSALRFLEEQTNDQAIARRVAFKLIYFGFKHGKISAVDIFKSKRNFENAIKELWLEFPYSPDQEVFEKLVRIYKKSVGFDEFSGAMIKIILSFQKNEEAHATELAEIHSEKPLKSCVVCLDDEIKEEDCCLVDEKTCCLGCIRQHIKIQIESNLTSDFDLHLIKCPTHGCGKDLLYSTCMDNIYDQKVFSNFTIIKLLNWRIAKLSHHEVEGLLHCPSSDCVQTFCLNDYVVSSEVYKKITRTREKLNSKDSFKLPTVQCPSCTIEFCTSCGSSNIGKCCEKLDEIEGIEQCPVCSAPYEKTGGCDYLKCQVCKVPFDAQTGEIWTKEYAKKKGGTHSGSAISDEKLELILKKYNSHK